MLESIFEFLEQIRTGITKPNARITMELYDMGNVEGLRFQFLWYEDKILKLNCFVPKDMIESSYNKEFCIDFLAEHIIHMVNELLKKKNWIKYDP